MEDCIFCGIINKDIPSNTIYEDDNVIAFLDINPVREGHVLVVPKQHASNVFVSETKDVHCVMDVVRRLAPAIQEAVGSDGFNVTTNVGVSAGQSVFHTHVHIIPRNSGDGLSTWPNTQMDQDSLTRTAERIRAHV